MDCPNFAHLAALHPERVIETDWGLRTTGVFATDIVVDAHDRQGLLRDISEIFTREKLNVVGVNTQSKQGKAHMSFTVEIANLPQLQRTADADPRGRRRGRRAAGMSVRPCAVDRRKRGKTMKGNFISVALIVIGAIALAVNLEWIEFDLVALLRKWWPLALIAVGLLLFVHARRRRAEKFRIVVVRRAARPAAVGGK